MYQKIKKYYESGLWNFEMVKNAVIKGRITEEQFEDITGVPYSV